VGADTSQPFGSSVAGSLPYSQVVYFLEIGRAEDARHLRLAVTSGLAMSFCFSAGFSKWRARSLCGDAGNADKWRFDQKISEATRLSDDPQCYWQPPRRRPPSRGVLVCRRHLRFFRQVADTSPPRTEGNHPNPCLALRVRPLLMAQGDSSPVGQHQHPPTVQGPTSYPDRVWLPGCHANSDVAGAFEAVIGRAGTLRREFLMSKVVQLRAAVALRGFALPQHLNLMSSDADDRAGSAGLVIVLAHPDDAVT
jgi:hypothetical protein